MRLIPAYHLRALRNRVAVVELITHLAIPTRTTGARFSFRCPQCGGFPTATDPATNLARCFHCQRNFNPIELVMAERHLNFLDAVRYLEATYGMTPATTRA